MPSSQDEGNLVDIQLLSEDSNPDAPIRRDAYSNLPDQLNFKVPLTKDNVTLRMKRSRLLPTATSHGDVTAPFSENAAVYTDEGNRASMVVRRHEGHYTLPSTRVRRQTGGRQSHRLLSGRINAENISFVGDAIIDDEPPVEILSLADRNFYRLQRLAGLLKKGSNVDQSEGTRHHQNNHTTSNLQRATTEHIVEIVLVVDYADYQNFDIREAAGVAFLGRVCTTSGVSIIENDFTAAVATLAAHELGHRRVVNIGKGVVFSLSQAQFVTICHLEARIHIDDMESEPFPIKRGVRQGDQISPKLFTTAIEDCIKKSELTDGIDIDGETLTDLRFADDVALFTKTPKQIGSQMNTLNKIS
ncbi:endonuclease-reverse transcriptase [Elysia marginata]|uniref:Endonuclease-reverse transcriptase n=1 Tax=Elysia marginata TaxID=1093978 RepID=A0AAV4HX23_9GAST|nr:endonuclease-reverse transcriptase [Elysia marginata]